MSRIQITHDDRRQFPSAGFRFVPLRWLAATAGAAAVLTWDGSAQAQAIDCPPPAQTLVKIPEIVSDPATHVLRGTVVLAEERQRLMFRSPVGGKSSKPGDPAASYQCQEQIVRAFHRYDGVETIVPDPNAVHDPVPGPTLRARVGDIVELSFVNDIDANRFGRSIDQGEKRNISGIAKNPAVGCDTINTGTPGMGYPYTGPTPFKLGDSFPDCFHGSSTGNIHFHGTHTNPSGTGDNVLLEIRPSPRVPKPGSTTGETIPTITPASVAGTFDTFFTACESKLRGNVRLEWPKNWDEAPLGPWTDDKTWTAEQKKLLQAYDAQTKEDLWGADKKVIDQKLWPQYYIGAFPYCFQIPAYAYGTWPPPPGGLRMGQAPGVHWYHAHKHGSTAIDVANGMTGAFIIEGKYDDDLDAYYGAGWTRSQPLLIINQLSVSPNLERNARSGSGQQDKGPDFMVNGRSQPMIDMAAGEVQLWRIVNTSGRSGAYFAGFPPGFQWKQIAQDGVQFADENYQNSLNKPFLMAAGNRVDLLVKAPSPGTYAIQVQHEVATSDLASAHPVVLVQVRVRRDVPPASGNRATFIPHAPEQPPFLTNITDAEVASTINNPRVITFASTATPSPSNPDFSQHTINNHKFDGPGDVPIPVTLEAVEEWKIVNATYAQPISHPFHIHVNPFQIVEVFDPNATATINGVVVPKYVTSLSQLVDQSRQCLLDLGDQTTWKDCHNDTSNAPRIWWDVFPIPTGASMSNAGGQTANVPGYFRMRSRFVDFPGNYVLHCHILAHEDRGMMSIVELTAPGTPATAILYHHH